MECFNQKQKTIIHKFWIQGSAALIQSPPTHTVHRAWYSIWGRRIWIVSPATGGERLGGICCMLSDEEMSFRLLLCWWERRWQWFEDQQLLECRGFVLVSPFYRWSQSADRKTNKPKKPKLKYFGFLHDGGVGTFFFFCKSYLEAKALEMRVKVVQHSAAIKHESRLQHVLVNLIVVQFLWWD